MDTVQNDKVYSISREKTGEPPILVNTVIGGQFVFTRSQFAYRIGVQPSTLRTWERKGMLVPEYTVSGRKYYTEGQATAYLKAGKKGKHTDSRT